jgi:hypothetical protein
VFRHATQELRGNKNKGASSKTFFILLGMSVVSAHARRHGRRSRAERLVQTEIDTTNSGGFTGTAITRSPVDHLGWVAGAGAESLLFGTNWVGRIEYLHYDFGNVAISSSGRFDLPGTPVVSFASSAGHQTIDLVRAGVSYKFGDPALASASPAVQRFSGRSRRLLALTRASCLAAAPSVRAAALPDGQITSFAARRPVQPHQKKYSGFPKQQISSISPPSRPTQRGVAQRHERGAGCGGRGWCA